MSDWVLSSSVTISTGPNSPIAPAPSTNPPSRVDSAPASRMIGISVPSAVVAIAEPVSRPEMTTPVASSTPASEYASTIDMIQPSTASRTGLPRITSKRIS